MKGVDSQQSLGGFPPTSFLLFGSFFVLLWDMISQLNAVMYRHSDLSPQWQANISNNHTM